jgi:hypothetical protein
MSARRESLAGVISTIASSCVRWETTLTHNTKLKSGVTFKPFKNKYMSNLNFGQAIEALKDGKKVCRQGWNGKGMFLYYVPENKYPASRNTLNTLDGMFQDNMVPYGAYIAMKTAQDNVIPWLASQTDMLSEDWMIVE